jgi:peptide/nickel transport system permease protein
VVEVVDCFPYLFLIISLMALATNPSIFYIMVIIGLTHWTGVMRLVRGEFLRLVGLDFVTAARALGFVPARIVFRHVLPNALGPVLVTAAFGVAGAILTESALSFLGFGVPAPQASWGSVLHDARGNEKALWWVTVFPGVLIFVTVTAYNLVGEGLRDALDPRLRR